MDDDLEKPSFDVPARTVDNDEGSAQSEDEDDGGPDWTRFSAANASKPYMPKRGDKEHEPLGGVTGVGSSKGSGLQQHKLDMVRAAMFGAIDVDRIISSKIVSHAIWLPQTARARMLKPRGNFLSSMGQTVSVDALEHRGDTFGPSGKPSKAVELLPEEALYLIERGSMLCYSELDSLGDVPSGPPMSVQQAYVDMIGRDKLTLEKFQVYAYLKRLGYTVTRASRRDREPTPQSSVSVSGLIGRLCRALGRLFAPMLQQMSRGKPHNWWAPLGLGIIHRFGSQSSVFSSLRFFTSGHRKPLHVPQKPRGLEPPDPYTIFFHVFKPPTPFRKTSPPPPDFHVVVVNARETSMPSLAELCDLFDAVSESGPPKSRPKQVLNQQTVSDSKPRGSRTKSPKSSDGRSATCTGSPSPLHSIITLLTQLSIFKSKDKPRRTNPFQMLKAGKRIVVVAAVDCGVISFYRLGQGCFEEVPMC